VDELFGVSPGGNEKPSPYLKYQVQKESSDTGLKVMEEPD
jgi:hypothetical protein